MKKIKVFKFLIGSDNEKIEEQVNEFMKDKMIWDVKITTAMNQVSPSAQPKYLTYLVYTILYEDF